MTTSAARQTGRKRRRPILPALVSAFVAPAALIAGAFPAFAHDSRPLFIEIEELGEGRLDLRSMAPGAVDRANAPSVRLEPPCVEERREAADPRRQHALYACDIASAALSIDWPSFNPSISTLVRTTYASGETRTVLLDPSTLAWRAAAPENVASDSRSYFQLGVRHIVGGVDHLLFLAGLLVIAGTLRRALVTITGFTLAHSLTLALVAFDIVRISAPATEAVIALSIVFLATEIARGDRTTLAWRRPLLVASAFGLAHGAGFAAALGEIGLPKGEALAALLFFNVGVEAGQFAIASAIFAGFVAARRLLRRAAWEFPRGGRDASLRVAAGYGLGILSGYWFAERAAALFLPA